jgi:hypothetical protein
MGTGVVISQWNQWVEKHGGEGEATLNEIKVGMLDCYLDGSRYRLFGYAGELLEELSLRESLLESLAMQKLDQDRFRQRVEHWNELARRILPEIYTVRGAIASINQRYCEGQGILFPSVAEGFDEMLALVEKVVNMFNESLAGAIERLERPLVETGDGGDKSPLTIELAELIESVPGAAKEQVSYLVDMAKADALDVLGETRQALELVDRHV